MNSSLLNEQPLNDLICGIVEKKFSCVKVMESFLNNIKKYNKDINAIVWIDYDYCIKEAKKADEELAIGKYRGVLHGIPVSIKDNILTTDYPTTACSDVLKGAKKSQVDAVVVKKLKEQGAIVIAKTNMHEFAYGATNLLSNIGATRNPWNINHITGGSSGGSGAGLASRMFPVALGSDTGGSIRIPSAGCGVSGIKPSHGLVSKEGVLPLSFSLDVVGPMAKSAFDLEIVLKTIIDDKHVGTVNYYQPVEDLQNLTFGVPVGLNFERDEDTEEVFQIAIETLKSLGATIKEIEIPLMQEALGAWKAILYAEATAYHKQNMQKKHNLFNDDVRLMLESGEAILAVDYIKAHQFREVFIDKVNAIFKEYDGLLFTTLPKTPCKTDVTEVSLLDKVISPQDSMIYLAWLANYLGTPQISIPCGLARNGLPVGLAIMSKAMDDFKILQISKCYQNYTNFHKVKPKL